MKTTFIVQVTFDDLRQAGGPLGAVTSDGLPVPCARVNELLGEAELLPVLLDDAGIGVSSRSPGGGAWRASCSVRCSARCTPRACSRMRGPVRRLRDPPPGAVQRGQHETS
ncbi:MAG: hypothetical protein R2705_11560 [Ilumatobacteraceae bacterium]